MAYLWVWNSGDAPDQLYAKMVRDLQPGGVLLSGRSGSAQTMNELRDYVAKIRSLYPDRSIPPLIGADYLIVKEGNTNQNFGVGTKFSGDLLNDFTALGKVVSEICLQTMQEIKAIAHRIVGINHPLGPVVEQIVDPGTPETELGKRDARELVSPWLDEDLVPTMKHFPFTVKDINLHHGTARIPLTEERRQALQQQFLIDGVGGYVVMTTHVGSPQVDGGQLVTFSKEWIGSLRKQIGDKNLIMSDGLFMLANYPEELAKLARTGLNLADYISGDATEVQKLPWNYAFDPCFIHAMPVLRRYSTVNLLGLRNFLDVSVWESQEYLYELYRRPGITAEQRASLELLIRRHEAQPRPSEERIRLYKENAALRVKFLKELHGAYSDSRALQKSCTAPGEGGPYYAKFADYFNGKFDPERARKVAFDILTAFAEKAISAGHDLFILEGHPDIARQVLENLTRKSCSSEGGELKSRIEEAYERIMRFKSEHQARLRQRASDRWLKDNDELLKRLFGEIYPRLNDPSRPCRSVDIQEASTALGRLCGR